MSWMYETRPLPGATPLCGLRPAGPTRDRSFPPRWNVTQKRADASGATAPTCERTLPIALADNERHGAVPRAGFSYHVDPPPPIPPGARRAERGGGAKASGDGDTR